MSGTEAAGTSRSASPAASGPAGDGAAVPARTAPTARDSALHPRAYLRDDTSDILSFHAVASADEADPGITSDERRKR